MIFKRSRVKYTHSYENGELVTKRTNTNGVGILLENGEIHILDSDTPSEYQTWELTKRTADGKPKHEARIKGEVLSSHPDPVQFRCNLILALQELGGGENDFSSGITLTEAEKNENTQSALNPMTALSDRTDIKTEIRAYIFHEELEDITNQLRMHGIEDLTNKDQLIGMFEEQGMLSHFIYFQKDKKEKNKKQVYVESSGTLHLFKVVFEERIVKPKKKKLNLSVAEKMFKKIADVGHESSTIQYTTKIVKVSTIQFDVEDIIS